MLEFVFEVTGKFFKRCVPFWLMRMIPITTAIPTRSSNATKPTLTPTPKPTAFELDVEDCRVVVGAFVVAGSLEDFSTYLVVSTEEYEKLNTRYTHQAYVIKICR